MADLVKLNTDRRETMDRYIPYLKIGFHIWQRLRKAENR